MKKELGQEPDLPFLSFADLEKSVRDDLATLKASPFLLKVPTRGFIYDVKTGRLREVA